MRTWALMALVLVALVLTFGLALLWPLAFPDADAAGFEFDCE